VDGEIGWQMSKTNSTNRGGNGNQATPGNVLQKFFMDPLGLTAYRVAKDIGVTAIAISHILRGQRSITPAVAMKLGQYFGVEADFWLSLQAHCDLASEGKKAPKVGRCAALEGRAFALKETKLNGTRNWQVLMVKARSNGNGKR
jgi:addiction module HigA family antidote